MIESMNPRETILVAARAPMKIMGRNTIKDNIITLNWHMPVSFKPPLFAVALGKTRFTLRLLQASGIFSVNLVPLSMKDAAVYCGSFSGEHIDKFAKAGLEKGECSTIDCPYIKGSVVHMECKVAQSIDAGDHVLIIGTVLHEEKHNSMKRLFNQKDRIFVEL
jgi:flavin reductase (DIM6/NTAB) family NADH-FMN oxidoreductase RutF